MNTSTLTPMVQQELRLSLELERDRLRGGLRSLDEAVRALSESQNEESGPGGEQADVASDLAEQAVDLALAQADRNRLAEVEAALGRLAAGRYGLCDACGEPIDVARLRARPWARRCLRCEARGPRVQGGALVPPSPNL